MPICINPDCGRSTKTLTPFCPHCGKATLSNLNKIDIGDQPKSEISMELFETQTKQTPPKIEDELRKQKKGFTLKMPTFGKGTFKKFLSFLLLASLIIFSLFFAAPSSFRNSIADSLGLQKTFPTDFQGDKYGFKFLFVSENGLPAYMKGCGTIPFYIRANYATFNDMKNVSEGLTRIGQAYGRDFKFAGYTDKTEVKELPKSLLINFTSSYESKVLRDYIESESSDVAGLAGPDFYSNVNKPRFDSLTYEGGTIWINKAEWLKMNRTGKIDLIMHEAGHFLGLDHPKNGRGQLMNATVSSDMQLGSGDILGLQILAAIAGCRELPKYPAVQLTKIRYPYLERSTLMNSKNTCGDAYIETVTSIDAKIPAGWTLRENDGCGSGKEYVWTNPLDNSESVKYALSASVGWCLEISPDDFDAIGDYVAGTVKSRVDGEFEYLYSRNDESNGEKFAGLISVGNSFGWCSEGVQNLEFSGSVGSNTDLTADLIEAYRNS